MQTVPAPFTVAPGTAEAEKACERRTPGKRMWERQIGGLPAVLGQRPCVGRAEDATADYHLARLMNKHKAQAAREFPTALRDLTPAQCASVVAGMYLYLDQNPHKFVSDQGFTFELVRRFRSISDANIGFYEDGSSGRVRRAYREIPPRTIEQLGVMLIEGFKRFVTHVSWLERGKMEREKEVRTALYEGAANVDDEEA